MACSMASPAEPPPAKLGRVAWTPSRAIRQVAMIPHMAVTFFLSLILYLIMIILVQQLLVDSRRQVPRHGHHEAVGR